MVFGILLYSIALCAQVVAAAYALNLYFRSKAYRPACGFLAVALGLMIGRRILPILHYLVDSHLNLIDAWISLLISAFLLFGIFQIKQILIDLENKNFLLDQSLKTDFLTGALSRPEAFYRSEIEIERSFRGKKETSFLMLDIDFFKLVNDRYGHPFGDEVLKNLVLRCQEQLRVVDILGRVGGEEFFILLPETNQAQALEIAERLRHGVELKPFGRVLGKDVFITISIGISVFDPCKSGPHNPSDVLKQSYELCDQAMYRAKQSGRNRICI
jgi:diguanylate cyclase (GGDEF)-like protein